MARSRKSPLYDNCIIQAPDGQPLCRTSEIKIQWYVKRNLGNIISTNPITLRLLFEPKGRIAADHLYTIAEKNNVCVVCGIKEELTRHHVIPKCFRKFFPLHMKEHAIHDVLILCINCHNKYEDYAFELKKKISNEFNVPINSKINDNLFKVKTAASALSRHYDVIPEPRKTELLNKIKEFLQVDEVTKEDIKQINQIKYFTKVDKPFGQLIVEKLENINDFIFMWRKHFVEVMQPKYLPIFWNINNILY